MFKEKVIDLLAKHVNLKKDEIAKLIEIPKNEFGDFAFPCFVLAREMKKNPVQIASELTSKLTKKLPKNISEIKSVGAYVNFFVKKENLFDEVISKVLKEKESYGSSNLGKGKKVLIEHTSLNPNSSPHVGRIRNALIGDSISKIFKFQGYNTDIHYYVNDISKQIALLACACKGKEKFSDMLKIYVKASKKPPADAKLFELINKFESKDKETIDKFHSVVECCVKGQLELLSELGIKYDKVDYESDYIDKGSLILEKLKKTGKLFKDKEGRFVLNQEDSDLKNEMRSAVLVLTRSNGTGLYVLRDLAYTIDKISKSDLNFIVLGEEQKLYFKQLRYALELLKYHSPVPIHYSFVLLQLGGKTKKMSTRKGELVLLSDFLAEARKKASEEMKKRKSSGNPESIALAAIKYSILRVEENKNVIFSWQEALNFEGDSGPYLQYAHARCNSILKKAVNFKNKSKSQIFVDKEIALIKVLQEFPEICEIASKNLRVHGIANYTFKLAKTFNDFYESCPVLQENCFSEARLEIVKATKHVLKNSLSLLGIEAPDVM